MLTTRLIPVLAILCALVAGDAMAACATTSSCTVTVPVVVAPSVISSPLQTTAAVQEKVAGTPRPAIPGVTNPFVKPTSSAIAAAPGSTSAWRPVLFQSANVALDQNPRIADLPACSGGNDGDCIANAPTAKKAFSNASAQDDDSPAKPIEKRRALIIGNHQYASPMASLPGTTKDSADMAQALQRQGFDVVSLSDAGRRATVSAFNQLIKESGEDDSVIVYYAGHGHIHPGTASGYWLPADADVENPATWISNADISRMLTNIGAKQILLVSDSCFSGALTREAEGQTNPAQSLNPNRILKQRSVAVMSSGGEEPVADSVGDGNSPFAGALLQKINALDQTKEPIKAQSTLADIQAIVSKNARQTPQYGVLMSAGHAAGGDYLFGAK